MKNFNHVFTKQQMLLFAMFLGLSEKEVVSDEEVDSVFNEWQESQEITGIEKIAAAKMGAAFNPSGNVEVEELKELATKFTAKAIEVQGRGCGDTARNAAIAITSMQQAKYAAVDAIFTKARFDALNGNGVEAVDEGPEELGDESPVIKES